MAVSYTENWKDRKIDEGDESTGNVKEEFMKTEEELVRRNRP
jgi:hypothetical protein